MSTRANIYQAHADRCRLAAETAIDLTARDTFLIMADQWATLAQRIERMDYLDGPLVRPRLD